MKKKNVASMAMAAMMAAGALPMNAWAAPEVNHDETLTIEVYDVAAYPDSLLPHRKLRLS